MEQITTVGGQSPGHQMLFDPLRVEIHVTNIEAWI